MQSFPPLFSTFTLCTEILITVSVLYILYSGYKHNLFRTKLVLMTLGYEILINITYMAKRAIEHEQAPPHPHTAFHIAVAAFHGIFSLLMFLLLILFFTVAWKKYKKGANFFKDHSIITFVFLVMWLIAIFSGIFFYYLAYFTKT